MLVEVKVRMEIPYKEIISKYGVKIWNGDKICGSLIKITEKHIIIIGTRSGTMENIPKEIAIDKKDVYMVYNSSINSYKDNIIWKENKPEQNHYETVSNNLLYYSSDDTMSKPKPGYEKEWKSAFKDYKFVKEILEI